MQNGFRNNQIYSKRKGKTKRFREPRKSKTDTKTLCPFNELLEAYTKCAENLFCRQKELSLKS